MYIEDVIYDKIEIEDDFLIKLSNSKAIQRLRDIKQQGNTYFLNPSSIHDRLSHTYGVFHLMNKYIKNFDLTTNHITEREQIIALSSALLHDVGHGPFSHCFEGITGEHHEKRSINIIREDDQINNILSEVDIQEDVVNIIERGGKYPLLEAMLFSQTGADKLDYLNRDLYYSSLSLPPISYQKIIDSTRIYNDKLLIEEDAISCIEHLLYVKKQLFLNTFNHPAVIAKDLLLQKIFRQAIKIGEIKIPITHDEYLLLNDSLVIQLISKWKRDNTNVYLSKLCENYELNLAESNTYCLSIDEKNYRALHSLNQFNENKCFQVHKVDESYGIYKKDIYIFNNGNALELSSISNANSDFWKSNITYGDHYYLFLFHN